MKTPFLEKINNTPLIFDGATGTVIYEKGVFLNTCYDELNLTRPDLIKEIHQDYINAGADVILTNTFGANRIKLEKFGLADKVKEINHAGVNIVKSISEDVYILGLRQLTAVAPETACVWLNKGKCCFYVQKTHFGAVSSHSIRSSGVFQQVILYRPTGDLCRPMGGFMPSNGGLYALRLALFWRF